MLIYAEQVQGQPNHGSIVSSDRSMDPLNDRLLDPPHQPLEVESRKVAAMLKAIHAQEDREAARVKVRMVTEKLKELKLGKAAALVEGGAEETFSYYDFPQTHWRSIRTNNPLERVNRELRKRTRIVGNFPDGKSACKAKV